MQFPVDPATSPPRSSVTPIRGDLRLLTRDNDAGVELRSVDEQQPDDFQAMFTADELIWACFFTGLASIIFTSIVAIACSGVFS